MKSIPLLRLMSAAILPVVMALSANAQATPEAKGTEGDSRPFLAVIEFKAPKDAGVDGWTIARNLEHALYVQGKYRIANRSEIEKVVKEMKFKANDLMDDKEKAKRFGEMVGADFIVTGEMDIIDRKVSIVARMIDATRDVGEIKHSAKVSLPDISKLDAAFPRLAQFLTMDAPAFIKYGKDMMAEGRFEDAFEAFGKADVLSPSPEAKSLLKDAKAKLDEQRILDERAAAYKSLVTEGQALLEREDWLSAERVFKKALEVPGYAQDSIAAEGVKSAVAGVERKGRKGAAKKGFENAMASVGMLFEKARTFEETPATRGEARDICNKALDELESFLKDNRAFLSKEDLNSVNELVGKVEKYRDSLWAGPVDGKPWTVPELAMKLLPMQPGVFRMGSPDAEPDDDEAATMHPVSIAKPFWIAKYETSIGDFQYCMRDDAGAKGMVSYIDWDDPDCPIDKIGNLRSTSLSKSNTQPMVEISWRGADAFCKWLTDRERKAKRLPPGYEYRLPTEAEWEYCCRAGTQTPFYFGDQEPLLLENAVYSLNSHDATKPVEETTPNPWGVCGMCGNVWEWCNDWYGGFSASMENDPKGPPSSDDNLKSARGGSFTSKPVWLKSHSRTGFDYGKAEENIGFRIVLAPEL